jgi:hypothetical protein
MVLRLPRLAPEIIFSRRDILLTRVIGFLIVTIIIGHKGDMLGAGGHCFCPFLPPLAPILAPLMVALDGAARPPLEGGPNCLLTRGMLSGDVK